MAVAALSPELLAGLPDGHPADTLPTALDDLRLTLDREALTDSGEVPSSTAVWVGRLREIATAKLKLWGLSELIDDAKVLISELVTNGFRYGARSRISFRLVIGPDAVFLEVDDGSPGRPELREVSTDAVNGRGLLLVSVLAASWGVSEDGTRTWCVLRRPVDAQVGR